MFFKEVSSAQKPCIYLFQSRPTEKQYIFEICSLFKKTYPFEYILKGNLLWFQSWILKQEQVYCLHMFIYIKGSFKNSQKPCSCDWW